HAGAERPPRRPRPHPLHPPPLPPPPPRPCPSLDGSAAHWRGNGRADRAPPQLAPPPPRADHPPHVRSHSPRRSILRVRISPAWSAAAPASAATADKAASRRGVPAWSNSGPSGLSGRTYAPPSSGEYATSGNPVKRT